MPKKIIYTRENLTSNKFPIFSYFKNPKIFGFLFFLILIIGAIGAVKLTQQQQEIRQRADEAPWHQCMVSDGDEPPENLPCGSCSIIDIGAGTMGFGCELDCGGLESGCPGGEAGQYGIDHAWLRCENKGSDPCTQDSPDFVESGELGGDGPWVIPGQSTVPGSGTFPLPDPFCGRVQVDVKMTAEGTEVAGRVFDSGVDCEVPATSTPIPTLAPTSIPTAIPTAVPTARPTAIPTSIPTVPPTAIPTASPTITPTLTPRPTASPTPFPTATPRPTATPFPTATPRPTASPTPVPTATPRPTASPTPVPTVIVVAPTTPPLIPPTSAPLPTKVLAMASPTPTIVPSGNVSTITIFGVGGFILTIMGVALLLLL